jgi:hypothetical protein
MLKPLLKPVPHPAIHWNVNYPSGFVLLGRYGESHLTKWGGPVSSLVLLTECHGAQAEAQIPDPLGGSVANKTVAAGAVTDIAS